jgi:Spy/CpxP family protein refolding chaperone
MMPSAVRRLLLVLAALAVAGTVSAQSLLPGPWWKTDPVKKELGLTHEQSMHLDRIWSDALPQTQQNLDKLDRFESTLSRLVETDADEVDVLRQVDKIEALRATMNKNRIQMLVHMRQVLTPDQRTKMNVMMEQHDKEQKARQAQQAQQTQSQTSRSGTPQRPSQPPASLDPRKRPE